MADLRSQLQDGLSGSYALERELGRGGMATVFLAHDYLSPGWLRIDPQFDPIRKHPRFQKLIAGDGASAVSAAR